MNDEPQDEVEERNALEREARTTPQADPPGVMPGGAAEPAALRAALAASVHALLDEAAATGLAHAESVAQHLTDLR